MDRQNRWIISSKTKSNRTNPKRSCNPRGQVSPEYNGEMSKLLKTVSISKLHRHPNKSLILAKCWQNRRYTLEFSNILAQLWGLILLLKSLPIFYHFWLPITWVFKLFLVCFRNQVVEVGQKIRQIAVRSALLNVNKLWRVFPLFVEFWDLLNSCLKLVGTPGMLRFIW